MGKPGVFRGPIFVDLVGWGTGGFLFGGVLGYLAAAGYNRIVQPGNLADPIEIGNRSAFRLAAFAFLVVLVGHGLRAIFY